VTGMKMVQGKSERYYCQQTKEYLCKKYCDGSGLGKNFSYL